MTDRIGRVTAMEAHLDEAAAAISGLEQALAAYVAVQDKVVELGEYYAGEDWRQDFEADEAGLLPKRPQARRALGGCPLRPARGQPQPGA